jgi:hypothetical protein
VIADPVAAGHTNEEVAVVLALIRCAKQSES